MTKGLVCTWWWGASKGRTFEGPRAPPFRQRRQVSGRWKADQRALAPRVLEGLLLLLVVGLPCRRLPLPQLAGPLLLAPLPRHPAAM